MHLYGQACISRIFRQSSRHSTLRGGLLTRISIQRVYHGRHLLFRRQRLKMNRNIAKRCSDWFIDSKLQSRGQVVTVRMKDWPMVRSSITSKDSITTKGKPLGGKYSPKRDPSPACQVGAFPSFLIPSASTLRRPFTSSWRRRSCRIVDQWYRCADLVPSSSSSVGDL